ncbi:PucR family transcriptional regulator [Streptomyces odontomachi]|uniref:PucR family transcriptional regulator n=1 Tax=Streptomyces odontomachi TaxID=2944940 RepID=UPI002109FCCB|nr:PucR family transcriptional regulator [Streptomyces sp. ODS25]
MPPTLASLVHHTALKLTVRAGGDRLDVPVRWVHASELADPVPYMEGGELLLITALKLPADDPDAMRRYVRRLVRAGVAGLGFAVGVHYEETPKALLDAATAEGLPLIEVPRRTPFLAISKAVSAAIAAEQYRAVTAGFAAQRELTKQALADGPERLLSALAAQVDGWAALYDTSGALIAAAPDWSSRRAARLTPDVERLRRRPAPASAVIGGGADSASGTEDRVELHSLGTGRRPRAALAVGTAAALGTADRYAVHSAIALLTLTTERSRSLHAAEQRIGAAVLRMLLACEPDHARAVAGDLYGGLMDAPYRMIIAETVTSSAAHPGTVVVEPPPGATPSAAALAVAETAGGDPLEALADAVESAAARAGESVLIVPEHDRLVLLTGDGGAGAEACAEYAEALEAARSGAEPVTAVPTVGVPPTPAEIAQIVVGISAPAGLAGAPTAYRQAEQSLSVARRRGRPVVEHAELASGTVLSLLADDAVLAFADGLLRALREHDAHGRGDLVASLRAWLSHHGQWDAAAAELGVHRHTLRYRMRRVEEILGRSLDDPDVRMELWLALKATSGTL